MKLAKISLVEIESKNKYSSCTVYTVLFGIFFTINVGGIGAYESCLLVKQQFTKLVNGRNKKN